MYRYAYTLVYTCSVAPPYHFAITYTQVLTHLCLLRRSQLIAGDDSAPIYVSATINAIQSTMDMNNFTVNASISTLQEYSDDT